MNKNFVKLADTVEADANFTGAIPDTNTGDLVITYQKTLVDTTDNTSENDGAPVVITLNDTDTAAIMTIIGAAINANEAGTYTQGGAPAASPNANTAG